MTNNLSYETAVALKKAGFPQTGPGVMLRRTGRPVKNGSLYNKNTMSYVPSLTELIDACKGIELRLQSYYSKNDLLWQADNSGNFLVKPHDQQIAGVGDTPSQAVANLWLALHNK